MGHGHTAARRRLQQLLAHAVACTDAAATAATVTTPAANSEATAAAGLRLQQAQSSASAAGDLELFICALKEAHPGYGRYTPAAEMERLFERARSVVGASTTLLELETILAAIVCKLGCGHTRLRPSPAEQDRRRAELLCLPLSVRLVEERAYVLADFSGSGIPAGAELVGLDGQGLPAVVEALLRLIPTDGFIRTGRIDALNGARPRALSSVRLGPVPAR